MRAHEYQYEINNLITKDTTGLVTGFALQLDSILSEEIVTESTQKIVDETMQFLSTLVGGKLKSDSAYDYESGYREGYNDSKYGISSQY